MFFYVTDKVPIILTFSFHPWKKSVLVKVKCQQHTDSEQLLRLAQQHELQNITVRTIKTT